MRGRILWVDEDERIWATERNLLTGLGFVVVPIPDATNALSVISLGGMDDVSLVIMDVMLLEGDDEKTFSEQVTDAGMNTGLILAEMICAMKADYGKGILFFSRATKLNHIAKIKAITSKIGARYLQKTADTQGKFFVSWLKNQGIIEEPPP